MRIHQLTADGQDCIGSYRKMYSRKVFTSIKQAKEYIPEWIESIKKRTMPDGNPYLIYMEEVKDVSIIELELVEEE